MLCNAIGIQDANLDINAGAAPTWASRGRSRPDWRAVDRALRDIAGRRAALDAEEARWLREAEALQIWKPLGMVSMVDYLERVLGYAPRTAQDRLRVARALGDLPALGAALSAGRLSFSAVRELSRVATRATEADWLAAAMGKSLRQVEELVADHRPGDRPDDPPDPSARIHVVRFELPAETYALLRQARAVLDDEHGTNLADDAFVASLCHGVLGGASNAEPTGRAKFQIAVTVCQRCKKGWQEGAGVQIPIDAAAVERALCDAQHIGSIDGEAPERAHQDIPPAVERFVRRRDGGRCRVPGCRSSRGLELHHLVHRADGGTHEASNIALVCSSCHLAHHRGLLTISGTADRIDVRRSSPAAPDSAHVGASRPPANPSDARLGASGRLDDAVARSSSVAPDSARLGASGRLDDAVARSSSVAPDSAHVGASSRLDDAVVRTEAKTALTTLGWTRAIAHAAVDAAAAEGGEMTLKQLIVEALRRCPRNRNA